MLSPTILVTLRGPIETTDLELPGDVPVNELIPLLLEICGPDKNSARASTQALMSLNVAGKHAPLSLHKTLVDADVYDGAVLILQMEHTSSPQAERLPLQQFTPHAVAASTNTGGIGVTWENLR